MCIRDRDNPADLLTRGISFKEFQKNMSFWAKGPKWLSLNSIYWPSAELETASPVFAVVQGGNEPPVVDLSKYSNLHKLYRVVALLFQFGALSRGMTINHDLKARLYCLQTCLLYTSDAADERSSVD